MDTELHFSSANDVWAAPQWLFDALDKEFGFTLDPCSDGENQKCARHFTMRENGLLQSWGNDTVFMNPPYSECADWMRKAYGAAQEGATVVCLVPARSRLLSNRPDNGKQTGYPKPRSALGLNELLDRRRQQWKPRCSRRKGACSFTAGGQCMTLDSRLIKSARTANPER